MFYIRKAQERGKVNMGWLKSNHSFSFGSYHDPKHMGISSLRVINDDWVEPGQGFGTHGHRDMEIISYVVEGALEHQDSSGNKYVIPAGEVQLMSAGSGIMHSEYNASKTAKVNFLQIWIEPNVRGKKPSYQQKRFEQNGPLTPLVTPNGAEGSLTLAQDASLYRLNLNEGQSQTLKSNNGPGYLHLVEGAIEADGQRFTPGDAFALEAGDEVTVTAKSNIEALWFELPQAH